MARLCIPLVFTVFCTTVLAGSAVSAEEATISGIREPRSLRQRRLCKKYGICNQGGYGGFQGGHNGYGGYQGGYQGYQGGHQGGYGGIPPINIGISQSQSSANAGGGGYGHGSYPNNYQYNNHGYGGHGGYEPFQGGHQRPEYNNGLGSYNNQFNGNYYGGNGGGYGFQGPFGNGFYDDHGEGNVEHEEDGHHAADEANYVASGSFALAGRSKG